MSSLIQPFVPGGIVFCGSARNIDMANTTTDQPIILTTPWTRPNALFYVSANNTDPIGGTLGVWDGAGMTGVNVIVATALDLLAPFNSRPGIIAPGAGGVFYPVGTTLFIRVTVAATDPTCLLNVCFFGHTGASIAS